MLPNTQAARQCWITGRGLLLGVSLHQIIGPCSYRSHTVRQEKLLQGLMKEIVRLTTQKKPLEVGLPLYPFSHTTLFASLAVPPNDTPMAPLPNPSSSGQSYNSVLEMYSGPTAFSTVPSSLYHIASSIPNEMHAGTGQNCAAWSCSE